ncbi:MAG TPA: phospho-N-acetylmuramoyl-pentapeptide-transferase, partial [Actinomycetota bacterium]|nr:phospho-N-acetylmuramoyl-pentapeptide-transferase [Actinomycetota bacterium]
MTSILIAAAIALFGTLLFTPVAIRVFRLFGWGQRVREAGPHYPQHQEKMGTPTMGGLVIIGAMAFAYGAAGVIRGEVTITGLLVLGTGAGLALLGFIDDLLKVRNQRSLGLGKVAKIAGQTLVGLVFAYLLVRFADGSTELSFIRPTDMNLGLAFYVWVVLMMTAASNAVNLTDGLD